MEKLLIFPAKSSSTSASFIKRETTSPKHSIPCAIPLLLFGDLVGGLSYYIGRRSHFTNASHGFFHGLPQNARYFAISNSFPFSRTYFSFLAFLEAIAQRKEFLQKYLAEETPEAFKNLLLTPERSNLFLWLELRHLQQSPQAEWPAKLKGSNFIPVCRFIMFLREMLDIEETYLKNRLTVLSSKLVTSLPSCSQEMFTVH